jgi:hypothetical protein
MPERPWEAQGEDLNKDNIRWEWPGYEVWGEGTEMNDKAGIN